MTWASRNKLLPLIPIQHRRGESYHGINGENLLRDAQVKVVYADVDEIDVVERIVECKWVTLDRTIHHNFFSESQLSCKVYA